MAKTFDELVKRTTTKKTRARAAVRTQELLAEFVPVGVFVLVEKGALGQL